MCAHRRVTKTTHERRQALSVPGVTSVTSTWPVGQTDSSDVCMCAPFWSMWSYFSYMCIYVCVCCLFMFINVNQTIRGSTSRNSGSAANTITTKPRVTNFWWQLGVRFVVCVCVGGGWCAALQLFLWFWWFEISVWHLNPSRILLLLTEQTKTEVRGGVVHTFTTFTRCWDESSSFTDFMIKTLINQIICGNKACTGDSSVWGYLVIQHEQQNHFCTKTMDFGDRSMLVIALSFYIRTVSLVC